MLTGSWPKLGPVLLRVANTKLNCVMTLSKIGNAFHLMLEIPLDFARAVGCFFLTVMASSLAGDASLVELPLFFFC